MDILSGLIEVLPTKDLYATDKNGDNIAHLACYKDSTEIKV